MKNITRFLSVVALSLPFVACQNKETVSPESSNVNVKLTLTTVGSQLQTKTYMTESEECYIPHWTEDTDELGVLLGSYTANEKTALNGTMEIFNLTDDDIATFYGEFEGKTGVQTLTSFYPAAAYKRTYANGESSPALGLVLPTRQYPTYTSFDPLADILVGQQQDIEIDEDGVALAEEVAFSRVMAVLRVNLLSTAFENEKVNSVSLKVGGDLSLTGTSKIDPATASILDWTVKDSEVKAIYEEGSELEIGVSDKNSVYFVVNPTTIPAGTSLTFTIDSKHYDIVREVSAPSAMQLKAGAVSEINLTIREKDGIEKQTETRIIVEGFDNETTNKTQTSATNSGVSGTGVNKDLTYTYSTANTNVRFNSNGQTSSNPYLYLSEANAYLQMSNIAISNETELAFSAMAKAASGTGAITLQYKDNTSETWSTASTTISTTTTWSKGSIPFTVSSSASSLDIKIIGSVVSLVDDIVIEKFVDSRTKLSTPTNIVATIDEKTPNKINVKWDSTPNASGYSVVLSTSGDNDVVIDVTNPTCSFTGLKYSTAYSVKVKATTNEPLNYFESDFCSTVSVTTGAKPEEDSKWVMTAFKDLNDGDKVVFVATNATGTFAISNNNGTGSAPTAVEVSIVDSELESAPEENIVWTVGITDSKIIFYLDDTKDKWLYCTGTNNGVRVGTNTNKTFTLDNSGYLKHDYTSRYVGVYNNQDWRCYTTNDGNIVDQTFSFFVEQ